MKKTTNVKLGLAKETLRTLGGDSLHIARGGLMTFPTPPTFGCPPPCSQCCVPPPDDDDILPPTGG